MLFRAFLFLACISLESGNYENLDGKLKSSRIGSCVFGVLQNFFIRE